MYIVNVDKFAFLINKQQITITNQNNNYFLFCSICLVKAALCSPSQSTPADLKARARFALQLERPNSYPCEITEKQTACPPSKFRAPTAECNNIIRRSWGSRGDIFLRLLDASYADGRSQPRTSVGSHALPPPEEIVAKLQQSVDETLQHPHITAMLPAWGQLLSYDLIKITASSSDIKCCKNTTKSSVSSSEEINQCYVRSGQHCIEYKRSSASHEVDSCDFKYRNQMNSASGFIDGSSIYGTTEKDFQSIRTYSNGKVDVRACPLCRENGAIGILNTVLLQEHNRIADVLSQKNPGWSDTTLFLEARRAVTAQIQHITYNEFLPIILGQQIVNKDSLK